MASSYHHLLLLTILAVICLFSQVSSAKKVDPNDPVVVENAKFAIDEHNKLAQTNLQFKSVIEAEEILAPTGPGKTYRLVIKASDGIATNLYAAFVANQPSKKLVYFQKLSDEI